MSTGRAVLFDAAESVTVEELPPIDEPMTPTDVRIAPQYLGICGSDLHVLEGKHPFAKAPTVPGHEICAVVTEVGGEVESVSVGDHVVVDPIMNCGHCRACLAGRPNLCEPPQVAGFRAPGFGRTSHVVPSKNVHVAPKSIPLEILAFTEPVTCARHCVGRLPEPDREDVLVIGAGTIGLAVVQALRIMGAGKVTVIEPDANKRSLAREFGADVVVAPGELDEETFSGVIDVVVSQRTLMDACKRVVAGGTVVAMGVPDGDRSIPLPSMQRFERTLTSSGMYVPQDFDDAISWLADGRFDASRLVTDIFPLEEAAAAYARAKQPDSIKVLVQLSA